MIRGVCTLQYDTIRRCTALIVGLSFLSAPCVEAMSRAPSNPWKPVHENINFPNGSSGSMLSSQNLKQPSSLIKKAFAAAPLLPPQPEFLKLGALPYCCCCCYFCRLLTSMAAVHVAMAARQLASSADHELSQQRQKRPDCDGIWPILYPYLSEPNLNPKVQPRSANLKPKAP